MSHPRNDRARYELLNRLCCAMWDDQLVYHYQDLHLAPPGIPSIFLIGPSSREDILEYKWRIFAVHYLRMFGFTGVIYVPEPRENDWSFKDTFPMQIVAWESKRALSASVALVWLPRHQTQLPGRVTNTELGVLIGMALAAPEKFTERVAFGCPPGAWKVNSEIHWASLANITPISDLQALCEVAYRKTVPSTNP